MRSSITKSSTDLQQLLTGTHTHTHTQPKWMSTKYIIQRTEFTMRKYINKMKYAYILA